MPVTSRLAVVGCLMATLAFQVNDIHNMLWYITIVRGVAGVGVGGEHPTSAAAAVEGFNEHFDHQRRPNPGPNIDVDGHVWRVNLHLRIPDEASCYIRQLGSGLPCHVFDLSLPAYACGFDRLGDAGQEVVRKE